VSTSRERDDGTQADGQPPLAIRAAMALYPRWWRERYEAEQKAFMQDLRGEGRSLGRATANLAAGAVSARLRPTGMPRTVSAYRDRARASIAWAMVAAWALLRPLEALQGTWNFDVAATGPPARPNDLARLAIDVSRSAGWGAAALIVLLFASYLSLLLASSNAAGASASSDGHRSPRWRLLASTPLILGPAALVCSKVHSSFGPYQVLRLVRLAPGASITEGVLRPPHHPLLYSGLGAATTILTVAFLVLSPFAVAIAFRRVDLSIRDLRFSVVATRVVALGAVLAAVATIAWSYAITNQTPLPVEPRSHGQILGEAGKTIAYSGAQSPYSSSWLLIVLGAVAGAVVCVLAARSAARSLLDAKRLSGSPDPTLASN
jgi:hypothetical protein